MDKIYLEPNQVPHALRGAYDGKKFSAIITDSVTIPADAGLWSGGSRDTYSAIRLSDGKQVPVSDNMSSPWNDSRQDRNVDLANGLAVIRHSMFRGKDMGLTFYIHPNNAATLLPAPQEALSEHERIVLNATKSYKSSYNGMDRYTMAQNNVRWGPVEKRDSFPTREQWNDAKNKLIVSGHLNKAGAITVKGRNAI